MCLVLLGCWRWLRIFCQASTRNTFQCSKLLRGVWQRRSHDVCRWDPDVLVSDSKGKICFCHIILYISTLSDFELFGLSACRQEKISVRWSKFRKTRDSCTRRQPTETTKEVENLFPPWKLTENFVSHTFINILENNWGIRILSKVFIRYRLIWISKC